MTEIIHESLFDSLLKSRYPLTYYLSRQQEFAKIFSTTQSNTTPNPSESETKCDAETKTPLPPYHNIPNTIDHQASEFCDVKNGIISDQDYNTAHDRSSETDDDATQAYDEKPLLKSMNENNALQQ